MARRSKIQREQDLVLITELYVKNNNVRSIADYINKIRDYQVSHVTIFNDIKAVIDSWSEQREELFSEHVR